MSDTPVRRKVKNMKFEVLGLVAQAGAGWITVRAESDASAQERQVFEWAKSQLLSERLIIKGGGGYQITMEGLERLSRPAVDPGVDVLNKLVLALCNSRNGLKHLGIADALDFDLNDLTLEQINQVDDAVDYLESIGAVKLQRTMTSTPFNFYSVNSVGLMIRQIAERVLEGWDTDEFVSHEISRGGQQVSMDHSQTISMVNHAPNSTLQAGNAQGDVTQNQHVVFSPFKLIENPHIYTSDAVTLLEEVMNHRMDDGSYVEMIKVLSYLDRINPEGKTAVEVAKECIALAQHDGLTRDAITRAFHYFKHMENWPMLAQGLGVNLAYEVLKLVLSGLALG